MLQNKKFSKAHVLALGSLKSEKLRFLAIGAINTFLGIGLFSLTYFYLGTTLGYVGSLISGYLLSSTIAFFLFRKFVFTFEQKHGGLSSYFRFHVVYLLPLAFNILALPLLIELGGLNPYVAQIFFSATWIIYSYFGHSRFTFARQPQQIE
jgi:putative flippase GtrA